MDKEKLINSIKQLCKNNNISVSQLEAELDFSPSLISRWTKTTPSLNRIIDIADYFKVSLDEVIGRNNGIDDKFLIALTEMTDNNILHWHSNHKTPHKNICNITYDSFEYHINDEKEKEETYYTEFKKGFIIMYSHHKYNQALHPIDLCLYVQPINDLASNISAQEYSKDELMPLYLKVLNSLKEEAPIEILAEELKNDLIKSFSSAEYGSINKISYIDEK